MSLFDLPFSHFQKGGVWKSADIRNPGDLKTEIEEIQTQIKEFPVLLAVQRAGVAK